MDDQLGLSSREELGPYSKALIVPVGLVFTVTVGGAVAKWSGNVSATGQIWER